MVCNLADLDSFVQEKILERFDQQNSIHGSEFPGTVPTTENLCVEVYGILERDFHSHPVEKIRVEETMLNSFEYAGGRESQVLGRFW